MSEKLTPQPPQEHNKESDPFSNYATYENLHRHNHHKIDQSTLLHSEHITSLRQRQKRRSFLNDSEQKIIEHLRTNSQQLKKIGAVALSAYLAFSNLPSVNQSAKGTQITNFQRQSTEGHLPDLTPQSTSDIKREIIPGGDGQFKSFMDYRMVTDPTSRQYNLLQSPNIITSPQGLRCYQLDGCNYPLVAVGSGVTTEVGQRLNIFIQSDQDQEYILQAVVGDLKDNAHTDPTNTYHTVDNSVVEFLVDTQQLQQAEPLAATMGNLSYTNDGQFSGTISKIEVLDQVVDY